MGDIILTEECLEGFEDDLIEKEASRHTVQKYMHCVRALAAYAGGRALTKELAIEWKGELIKKGLAPATVNGYIAAANALFAYLGGVSDGMQIKSLRIQRKTFTDTSRELTKDEYGRLVRAARVRGDLRLALLFETICATGIRVGEVKYITLEAACAGRADISLKGKVRTILIPRGLCRKLKTYAKENGIIKGQIFITRSGAPMSRKQIWKDMKSVCDAAHVEPEKVYPHNLRHLFARTFYNSTKDVVKLADVLGHSDLSTTRVYLISTEQEHRDALEGLKLLC